MVDLLFTSADLALVDAILFLLEYMIELFDIDSSDSDSDSVSEQDVVSQSSEGIQLLQSVLNNAHRLPTHPLIISGIARYGRNWKKRSLFYIGVLVDWYLISVVSVDTCARSVQRWFFQETRMSRRRWICVEVFTLRRRSQLQHMRCSAIPPVSGTTNNGGLPSDSMMMK